MADKEFFYVRRFLNEKRGQAFIEADVSVTNIGYVSHSANLTIGDCSRSVVLDFSFWADGGNDESYASRLRKLNSLLTDLHAFRDALIASKKFYDKRRTEEKESKEEAAA